MELSQDSSTNNKLCGFCRHLFNPSKPLASPELFETPSAPERVDTYPFFPKLTESWEAGCPICGLLKPSIKEVCERIDLVDQAPATGTRVFISAGGHLVSDYLRQSISFDILTEGGSEKLQLHFDIYAQKGHSVNPRFRRLRMLETLCIENLSLMKDWINSCATSHTACLNTTVPPLPSRVIDVKSNPPRLLHSTSIENSATYAALSYTWGVPRERQYLTLIANEAVHMVGMPISELPQTFQDAIMITKSLELRYLWIDAICIIQDSATDMTKEMSNMLSIYENSHVTFSAASARDCHTSFLNRNPITPPLVSFPQRDDRGHIVDQLFVYPPKHYSPWTWKDIEFSSWNLRAWTFQERLVSRRIIHFGPDKIYFECLSTDTSEEGDRQRGPLYKYSPPDLKECRYIGYFRYWSLIAHQRSLTKAEIDTIYQRYYYFVVDFSARHLSFDADKAIAFSVVVHAAEKLLKGGPVCGLWMDDLFEGLLWRAVSGRSRENQKIDSFPSWSWFSQKGEVDIYSRRGTNTGYEWLPPDESSTWAPKTRDGSDTTPWKLRFSAILREVRLDRRLNQSDPSYEISPGGSALIYRGKRYIGEAFYDTEPIQGAGSSKWLLSFADRFANLKIERGTDGLVVEPTGNHMEFRRIGRFILGDYFKLIDGDYSKIGKGLSVEQQRELVAKEKRTWITLV